MHVQGHDEGDRQESRRPSQTEEDSDKKKQSLFCVGSEKWLWLLPCFGRTALRKTAATDSDYYEAATRERWRIGRPRPTENEEPV
jgi:hypothetical protein